MRVIIVACVSIAVALSGVAAVCGSASTPSAPTAGLTTPEIGCLAPESIPSAIPVAATSGACVTSVKQLADGSTVYGAADGTIGVVRSGRAGKVRALNATGAVSDLIDLMSQDMAGGRQGLVAFSVDQGIGLFDPTTGLQVSLAGRSLAKSTLAPDAAAKRIANDDYFALSPDARRPIHRPDGSIGAVTNDGEDESISLEEDLVPDISIVCATYIHPGGVIEKRAVCVDVSDLVPPPPLPPAATPLTGSDPCLASTAAQADAAHRIALTVSLTGISPAALTVRAGEAYDWTITTTDGVAHTLALYDDQGQLVRDAAGVRVCVNPPVDGSPVTVNLALAPSASGLTLRDTAHPGVSATVAVTAAGE